ncbi:MAG: helix-turn-helix transcriptional regulator [Actinobacteria bacterium]|nr:helix-turn-helix transcriptional regulator [Actinomycetota bacterium]
MIRTARTGAGLSQRELAARSGTSQPNISAYEHGTRDPSWATLRRIVEASGARLVARVTHPDPDLAPLSTLEARSAALVDVLLLADAIPLRTPPARVLDAPRIVSRR